MASKRKAAKRAVKRTVKQRKPAARKAPKAPRTKRAVASKRQPARASKARAKGPKKAPRKAPSKATTRAPAREASAAAAVPVTAFTLERVLVQPLRYEAAAALGRLETVELLTGTSEEGARVETLVFAPSRSAVQSSGEFVHRGQWNGTRLLTDKGHLLDVDGSCFCRDCETAGGYTVDDDE